MAVYNFPNSGGLKLNKDHASFTVAADVQPGAVGTFTANVLLALAQQFTTVNYSAWANQTGGGPYQDVDIECYPLTGGTFEMRFTNNTGAVIPANTVLNISYAALGI